MTSNEQAYTKDGRPRGERVPEDAPDVYANVVHANVGPFDVTMDFGFQTPEDRRAAGEGRPPGFDRVARVSMSHAHAKSLIPILSHLIGEFEKSAGLIPAPGFTQLEKE